MCRAWIWTDQAPHLLAVLLERPARSSWSSSAQAPPSQAGAAHLLQYLYSGLVSQKGWVHRVSIGEPWRSRGQPLRRSGGTWPNDAGVAGGEELRRLRLGTGGRVLFLVIKGRRRVPRRRPDPAARRRPRRRSGPAARGARRLRQALCEQNNRTGTMAICSIK